MLQPSRFVAGAVLAAATVASLAGGALAERPAPTTTSTTSTTSSTTTTAASSGASSTTSSSSSSTSSSSTTSTTTATSTTSTTATTAPLNELEAGDPGLVPPEIQAQIDAYPRTAAGSTEALVEATGDLPPLLARAAFGRFPVAGVARWSHDWLFPRFVPSFHTHEGTDVFAARGTPVLSPTAGRADVSRGTVGGLAVKVIQPDGTYWYLAHLEDATVADGERVQPGTVVGTVGASGNARGGPPHVHIEVHPHGGDALDPKPILDDYFDAAMAAAPDLVDAFEARARLVPDRLEPVGRRPRPRR